MSRWRVVSTRQAQKDARKLAAAHLQSRADELLRIQAENPSRTPPRFERLVGDLDGACSWRISLQHRLVSQVVGDQHTVKVRRMWTHFEERADAERDHVHTSAREGLGMLEGGCLAPLTAARHQLNLTHTSSTPQAAARPSADDESRRRTRAASLPAPQEAQGPQSERKEHSHALPDRAVR